MIASTSATERVSTHALGAQVAIEFIIRDIEEAIVSFSFGEYISTLLCAFSHFRFNVHIYPNGADEEDEGFLCIGLARADTYPGDISVKCHMQLLSPNEQTLQGAEDGCAEEFGAGGINFYVEKICSVETLKRHYIDEAGRIRFRVNFTPTAISTATVLALNDTKIASYIKEIGSLLNSAECSDAELIVQGQEFHVHRNILSARSPVFERMLKNGMMESGTSSITIPDTNATTMASFLNFIYTNSCDVHVDCNDASFGTDAIVGTWCYADTCSQGSFDIVTSNGDLIWRGQAPVERPILEGHMTQASLDDPNSWNVSLSDGCEITLSLQRETMKMHVLYKLNGQFHSGSVAHHSDSIVTLLEGWGDLLKLADKYCVKDLVSLCVEQLKQRMYTHTAAVILKIASSASQRDLKKDVLAYITCDELTLRAVKDNRSFDLLERELVAEVMETFLHPRSTRKRPRDDVDCMEFRNAHDWTRLSNAQLRRACEERDLATDGDRASLVALLQAQSVKS